MRNATIILFLTLFATCCKAQKLPNGKPNQILHMSANGTSQEFIDPSYSILNLQPPTNGTNGTSFINGSGVPAATVGNNGDTYLDFVALNIYTKAAGTWIFRNNIKGAQGVQGIAGIAGVQGIPGPVGPQGPAGTSGSSTSTLPTMANNADVLTYFNGQWVAIPGIAKWQQDGDNLTTGTAAGWAQTDPGWTDYVGIGFIKINSITPGSSVTMHYLYTDINGVGVDYQIVVNTVGITTFDPTHIMKVMQFTAPGVQMFLTVSGTVNYGFKATFDLAP